ncbi:MAG: Glucokinase [Phycisphaerae bacterium]|nr:Glucokinase [Phycisphaerae bacterium]
MSPRKKEASDRRKLRLGRNGFMVAVDLGGTKMLAAAMNDRFEILASSRKRTLPKTGPVTGEVVFGRICDVIEAAIHESGRPRSGLAGIGIGSPGPLDPYGGVLIDLANLPFKNFPIVERLRKKFKTEVILENDVNAGLYGEYCFGSARDAHTVLGVFPGTGIGGAIIFDGRIHHGASGAAGEFGHMIYDPGGPLCGCGRRGCIEAFSGRPAIAGRLAALAVRGDAPHLAADAGSDVRSIRSGAIARAIGAGDKRVEAVVREEAFRIGIVAASAVNLISPDRLVLGGGLVEEMGKLFVDEVTRAVAQYGLPFLVKPLKVVKADLGDDAVVMGAASLVAERIAGRARKG